MGIETITTITERKVPNSTGWYWVRVSGGIWTPILVGGTLGTGWGLSVNIHSHSRRVTEDCFEWGAEIPSPTTIESTEKLIADLKEEVKHNNLLISSFNDLLARIVDRQKETEIVL